VVAIKLFAFVEDGDALVALYTMINPIFVFHKSLGTGWYDLLFTLD
jgi:hypothetical protein